MKLTVGLSHAIMEVGKFCDRSSQAGDTRILVTQISMSLKA